MIGSYVLGVKRPLESLMAEISCVSLCDCPSSYDSSSCASVIFEFRTGTSTVVRALAAVFCYELRLSTRNLRKSALRLTVFSVS